MIGYATESSNAAPTGTIIPLPTSTTEQPMHQTASLMVVQTEFNKNLILPNIKHANFILIMVGYTMTVLLLDVCKSGIQN
jgi:hypothetical protein